MRQRARWAVLLVAGVFGCADVSLSPSTPATLEFNTLGAPAIVLGDTLRDVDGVAAPLTAIIRNQQGEPIADASPRFTYVDFNRDSSLTVDSVSGYVVALKTFKSTATSGRIGARFGPNLQAIRTVLLTTRPDSATRTVAAVTDTLKVTLPDTGSTGIGANTSSPLTVRVMHFGSTDTTNVANWLVKYELLEPANPSNDSTAAVFLVNDVRAMSNTDTTDGGGLVSRSLRVRSSKFPTDGAVFLAKVRVNVTFQGKSVKGAPILFTVPIRK